MAKRVSIKQVMTVKEWNDFFPRVTPVYRGERGFLLVYQTMDGLFEFEGRTYRAVGWCPPAPGKPFVEISESR